MTFLPTASTSATILVVDDEPDLRTLYELTLLREGYRVETAGSVQEGSAQLQSQHFDVVITDMRLPDGNGLDLSRTDYSAIYARAVKVNAAIWANDLQGTAGANEIDARTGAALRL